MAGRKKVKKNAYQKVLNANSKVKRVCSSVFFFLGVKKTKTFS